MCVFNAHNNSNEAELMKYLLWICMTMPAYNFQIQRNERKENIPANCMDCVMFGAVRSNSTKNCLNERLQAF